MRDANFEDGFRAGPVPLRAFPERHIRGSDGTREYERVLVVSDDIEELCRCPYRRRVAGNKILEVEVVGEIVERLRSVSDLVGDTAEYSFLDQKCHRRACGHRINHIDRAFAGRLR